MMKKTVSIIYSALVILGIIIFVLCNNRNIEEVVFIPGEGQTAGFGEADLCPHEIYLKFSKNKIIDMDTSLISDYDYRYQHTQTILRAPHNAIGRVSIQDGSEPEHSEIQIQLVNLVYSPAGERRRIDYREIVSSDASVCHEAWYVEKRIFDL